jgi:DNA adenine methylase
MIVYVSEYSAPDDFDCVWQCGTTSSLSANGVFGGSKRSVEKLFRVSASKPA